MKIISMLRCNLKHLILLLSVFHHKVHLITLVFYGFQLDIEQWGAFSNTLTVTFPIGFSVAAYAIVGVPNTTTTTATATGAANLTKTGAGVYMHGRSGWYFVIGKQLQWGKSTDPNTVTFPIKFTTAVYFIVCTRTGNSTTRGTTTYNIKTSSAIMLYGYEGDSGLWLAGGKQKQWGTNSSSSSLASISVTFPIAVSATYGVVGSVSRAGSLGSGDVAVVGCGSFRTNGFTAYFDALQNGDASVSTSVTWIAMCKA